MTEKPLNVRVAEALGCKPFRQASAAETLVYWYCPCPGWAHGGIGSSLAPYGEDTPEGWACTGPLMVRFGIGVVPTNGDISPPLPGTIWVAREPQFGVWSDNPEPLHAVCEVILTLAGAGSLPK